MSANGYCIIKILHILLANFLKNYTRSIAFINSNLTSLGHPNDK
jgi:hypothetical protein